MKLTIILAIIALSLNLKLKTTAITITDYDTLKKAFNKIKFMNGNTPISSEEISNNIGMNSESNNKDKRKVLGKMLLCYVLAKNRDTNKYSQAVGGKFNDIYGQLEGKKKKIGEDCKRTPFFSENKMCMAGAVCILQNGTKKCEGGFKPRGHRCEYSFECEGDMTCDRICTDSATKNNSEKLPPIDKVEPRMSQNVNLITREIPRTMVRHPSEIESVYELDVYEKFLDADKKLTDERKNVRDAITKFILKNNQLIYKAEPTNGSRGTYGLENLNGKKVGRININPDNKNEDTSSHELMHYVDHILGMKDGGYNDPTMAPEQFLSFRLWNIDPDKVNIQNNLSQVFIDIQGYSAGENRMREVPTNLLQEGAHKNQDFTKLNDGGKKFIKNYANKLEQLAPELKIVADYMRNRAN